MSFSFKRFVQRSVPVYYKAIKYTYSPAGTRSAVGITARCMSNEGNTPNACKLAQDPKVKVLYDGNCPLCQAEINVLKRKDKKTDAVDFIDITQPSYVPSQNANIGYDKAMEVMHVIGKDGKVHTKVGAMRVMYDAVGWGWMWNFTKNPSWDRLTDKAYMWFAKNRLWLTGRGSDSKKQSSDKS